MMSFIARPPAPLLLALLLPLHAYTISLPARALNDDAFEFGPSSSFASSPHLVRPRVAIVGAGMAGLSAARRLSELGLDDGVDVFEAVERIGGRIHSVPYYGGYLQHGAQYINGEDNPIYEIAKMLGVISDVTGDIEHLEGSSYLYGDCDVDKSDIELFNEFTAPLDPKYRRLAKEDPVVSRRDAIYDVYMRDYAEFLQKHNITGHRRDVFDALSLTFRSYWEFEWASDWKDQSLRNLADWDDHGAIGVSYATDRVGYKAIIDYVASFLGRAHLHLNAPIGNIRYEDVDGKVRLTFQNGSIVRQLYDYVIVTTSLGHLKKYHKTLFTPPLGRFKRHVIDTIGFGGSTKLYFRWAQPFWPKETESMVTMAVKGCNGKEDVDPFDSEITTLQPLEWEPNTVVMWIAGRGQRLFDDMDDDEVIHRTTDLVRRLMGNTSIPSPEALIRSKLTKNEYLLGSYSYVSVTQARQKILHSDLSIPLKFGGHAKVLFAGEATHHRLFETAIGAFLSGRRESDRLAVEWQHRHPKSLAAPPK